MCLSRHLTEMQASPSAATFCFLAAALTASLQQCSGLGILAVARPQAREKTSVGRCRHSLLRPDQTPARAGPWASLMNSFKDKEA